MTDKLEAIQDRYHYLEEKMSDPAVLADMSQFAKINKEYKDLTEIVGCYRSLKAIESQIVGARQLLLDSDPEVREMASAELSDLEPLMD